MSKSTRRELLKKSIGLSTAMAGGLLYTPFSAKSLVATRMRKPSPPPSMINKILGLGLSSNLKLCMDAGDSNSYSSGQIWFDVSGNGHQFYLGSSGSVQASDPTFSGTSGQHSKNEYWSFDGGDYFALTGSNPSWINNLHKNNARFTVLAWVYMTGSSSNGVLGTSNSNGNPGFYIGRSASDILLFQCQNATDLARSFTSSATVPINQWCFLSVSLDESVGASGAIIGINDTFDLRNSSYDTPATTDAGPLGLAARTGAGNAKLQNGSRIAAIFIWEGANLNQTQITSIYDATRSRFD